LLLKLIAIPLVHRYWQGTTTSSKQQNPFLPKAEQAQSLATVRRVAVALPSFNHWLFYTDEIS
jgi:hypothetical protein